MTTAQRAAAALENANLATNAAAPEIAGVDDYNHDQPIVSDDEQDNDDDADAGYVDEAGDANNEEVEFLGENLAPPAPEQEIDLAHSSDMEEALTEQESTHTEAAVADDTDEGDEQQSGLGAHLAALDDNDREELGFGQDEDSTGAVVRRSRRQKKKKKPTEIDFTNRAYSLQDGTLHINPTVVEQAREDTKITSEITKPSVMKNGDSRLNVRSPATAGISALALATLELPGRFLVTDSVVFHVIGVILAQQYSIDKGIKLFGDRARESIRKELHQLHGYRTYTPVHAHELTAEEKRQALAFLIFLTEKRCGKVKTWACVNGSTQRDYIPKETTASPTIMTDSVMITSTIDAHERRRVVTLDIPGAFLHADLDEEVVMLLRGQLANLMVQVDPELYGPYLRKTKKGESILYVRMLKAM